MNSWFSGCRVESCQQRGMTAVISDINAISGQKLNNGETSGLWPCQNQTRAMMMPIPGQSSLR